MVAQPADGRHGVLLLYPDSKRAALGSPGFRQVYRSLAELGEVTLDWGWYEEKTGKVVREKPDHRGGYDIVAFSVPFEPLYCTMARMLMELGIPCEARERRPDDPIVMAGGAAPTINPAVAGVMADVVYAGEAEPGIAGLVTALCAQRTSGAAQRLTPMIGLPEPIAHAAPENIVSAGDVDSSMLIGFDKPAESVFEDAGLVEVGRGCGRGCRFCAAGFVCLPVRHRPVADILRDAASFRGRAGRIGLVGASISDHRELKSILSGILDLGFGLTTSSFRADMLDTELARLLVRGGLRTVTIAPEAGSERLRAIINKRLTEDGILDAASACAEAGVSSLRLYYMVGLPWERRGDVEAIVGLTDRIRERFGGAGRRVTVSVNPFIPKPQTPFQWCPMAGARAVDDAYAVLGRAFRPMPGVTLKTLSHRLALREAVISLGDERVGHAIIATVRDGVPWKKALRDCGVDVADLVHREKAADEPFPWDTVMRSGRRDLLRASYEKALALAKG